jgi:hypothetical protein
LTYRLREGRSSNAEVQYLVEKAADVVRDLPSEAT